MSRVATPRSAPDDVRVGPLIERALHSFDRRLGDRAHSAGLLAVLAVLAATTVVVITAIAGSLFLIGTGTAWLHDHVAFFVHHPRIGAIFCVVIVGCALGTAFAAGRASVRGKP